MLLIRRHRYQYLKDYRLDRNAVFRQELMILLLQESMST